MRMLLYLDQPNTEPLVGFAEAVTRDPFYLIGGRPNPEFEFSELLNLRVATVSEVPTPWMCLQDDLRRAGLDPNQVDRSTDGTMAENAAALTEGELDVIQVFEPYAEQLLRAGVGHIWYAAAARGATSYTTLYTARKFADANPEVLLKLTTGLYRTQRWLQHAPPGEIAALIKPYFEDLPTEQLAAMVARYRNNGVWGRNPIAPELGFNRLKHALQSGGLISSDVPFESCIDNSYARQAMAAVDGG